MTEWDGKPRVFVGREIPAAGRDLVRAACDARVWPGELPPSRDALLEQVCGCAGILPMLTDRIDVEAMDAAGPQLRVISNFAAGVDNVDLAEATRRGIPVGNTPGVLTETTADLAWALLLAAARRIGEGERYAHSGEWVTWQPQLLLGYDVYGATLGIAGYGRIGQAVARRARGFGMRILYTTRDSRPDDTDAERVDFETLLAASDFVSIHVPLSADTYHLFDAGTLRRMKPTGILVNTARGGVVDPRALFQALHEGWIAAAALDVTEPEPILPDDPLLGLPNCLVVPHIGSATIATRNRMADIAARNLRAGLRGERLPYCANPAVYRDNQAG